MFIVAQPPKKPSQPQRGGMVLAENAAPLGLVMGEIMGPVAINMPSLTRFMVQG
jgi:hypothetical protein